MQCNAACQPVEKKTNKQNKEQVSKTDRDDCLEAYGNLLWEVAKLAQKPTTRFVLARWSPLNKGTDAAFVQELSFGDLGRRYSVRCLWCGRRRKTQAESCVLAPLTRDGGHVERSSVF